jgi:hypothetical protein
LALTSFSNRGFWAFWSSMTKRRPPGPGRRRGFGVAVHLNMIGPGRGAPPGGSGEKGPAEKAKQFLHGGVALLGVAPGSPGQGDKALKISLTCPLTAFQGGRAGGGGACSGVSFLRLNRMRVESSSRSPLKSPPPMGGSAPFHGLDLGGDEPEIKGLIELLNVFIEQAQANHHLVILLFEALAPGNKVLVNVVHQIQPAAPGGEGPSRGAF